LLLLKLLSQTGVLLIQSLTRFPAREKMKRIGKMWRETNPRWSPASSACQGAPGCGGCRRALKCVLVAPARISDFCTKPCPLDCQVLQEKKRCITVYATYNTPPLQQPHPYNTPQPPILHVCQANYTPYNTPLHPYNTPPWTARDQENGGSGPGKWRDQENGGSGPGKWRQRAPSTGSNHSVHGAWRRCLMK